MFCCHKEISDSLLKSNKITKLSVPLSFLIAYFIMSISFLPNSINQSFFLTLSWGFMIWGISGTLFLGIAVLKDYLKKKQQNKWSLIAFVLAIIINLVLVSGILFLYAMTGKN